MNGADDETVWRRPPQGDGAPPVAPKPTGGPGRARFAAPAPAHPAEAAAWSRPPGGGTDVPPPAATPSASRPAEYAGPPPNNPPPADWRPPLVHEPPPPRPLPPQDHDRLDVQEQAAGTLTNGIGLVVGAVLVVLLLILCARGLF